MKVKRLLVFFLLLLLLAASALVILFSTSAGTSLLIASAAKVIPGSLHCETSTGSLFTVLTLENLEYTYEQETFTADRIELSINLSALLQKQVRVPNLALQNLHLLLSPATDEPLILPEIALPFTLILEHGYLEGLTIDFTDPKEPEQRIDQVSLTQVKMRGHQITLEQGSVVFAAGNIDIAGGLQTTGMYPLDTEVEYLLDFDDWPQIRGKGNITGTLKELMVTTALESPVTASLTGSVTHLFEDISWEATTSIAKNSLQALDPDWPAFLFTNLKATGNGDLSSYAVQLQSKVAHEQAGKDGYNLVSSLQGDTNGLTITSLSLENDGGALQASGSMTWLDFFSWQAEVNGEQVNPAILKPDWPGTLSFSASSSGKFQAGSLSTMLDIPSLTGTLRGYPIKADGTFEYHPNKLKINSFKLHSGSSEININGNWNDEIHLDFAVTSNNLEELWPAISGTVDAKGKIQGKPSSARIDLQLSGTNIQAFDTSLGKITAKGHGSMSTDGNMELTATTTALSYDDFLVDYAAIHLQGNQKSNHLQATFKGYDSTINFQLNGGMEESSWSGTLGELTIKNPVYGTWKSQQSQNLHLSPAEIKVDRLCLKDDMESGICAQGSWQQSGKWQFKSDSFELSHKLASPFLQKPLPVTGTISGNGSLEGTAGVITRGNLSLDGSDINLIHSLPEELQERVSWEKSTLTALFEDGLLTTKLQVLFPENSAVTASINLDNIQPPYSRPQDILLSGQLHLGMKQLQTLNPLLGNFCVVEGSLNGELNLGGSLSAPEIEGEVTLEQGKAHLPTLGISLDPLTASIKSDNALVLLKAAGTSENGTLEAESRYQLAGGLDQPLQIHLSGNTFTAFSQPELHLVLSPDLDLTIDNKELQLTGKLHIPEASIKEQTNGGDITPSTDVVVIDREIPDEPSAWPLHGKITLTAGDKVVIDASGLKSHITGKLEIDDIGSNIQTGKGILNMQDASFTIYGRRLKIDVGRLLFTGGPINDPGIELRSERTEDSITTGVTVGGFLRNPEIDFYSTPYMEQHEIISKLFTSTAIGGETREDTGIIGEVAEFTGFGQLATMYRSSKEFLNIDEVKVETSNAFTDISLIIGSWLTPRFYISYGRNLLKESGSFKTRYTIGKGFYLKTETGTSQSGGDIKYEFQR